MVAKSKSITPNGYIDGAPIIVPMLNTMPKTIPHFYIDQVA